MKSILRISMIALALLVCRATSAIGGATLPLKSQKSTNVVANRAPLEATPFIALPLGSVQPEGWLQRQLELQRDGLTGSAENLYDALTPNSGWLGGDGESWEKGPYYVRGLVALAYTLHDPELEHRAQKWIDWALQSQQSDGSFGPKSNDDWWPRMIVLFYLRDYYEATGDPRVIPFFTNYFHYQLKQLPHRPLKDWARARAGDNIDVVLWTYNRTGDQSLLDLARLLHQQAYPWTSIYTDNRFYDFGSDFHPHHIVNVSQALKFPPLCWEFTHDAADCDAFEKGVANLNRQYGRIDGQISGTEFLSSRSSTAGVELCADIERIISDSIAVDVLGDAKIADNLERIAYNSLPAHTTARMQQMTYYQLPNEVTCTLGTHAGFTQDYANGTVPGPHSGYPCCCYNWHTGWPEFVHHMWAATNDGGLAAIAYGPNKVTATVADDVPITITQATDYPFKSSITLTVDPERPVKFSLALRIPGWTTNPTMSVNGEAITSLSPGSFRRIDRQWKKGDRVEITFPMPIRVSTWINNSAGIQRGPLAFSLRIKQRREKIHDYLGPFDEYQFFPVSPWNYCLDINRQSPEIKIEQHPISAVPFDPQAPPVVLKVPGQRLPEWGYRKAEKGASELSAEPPVSPVISTQPIQTIELIPYGSERLRISYFPVAREK